MPYVDLYHYSWLFCALFAFAIGVGIHSRSKQSFPLPPGPAFLTFIRDLDGRQPYLTFTTWASTYGKVLHFGFFNHNTILLNTEEAARALLEQHSTTYADRPLRHRIRELHGLNYTFGLMPYGDEWRFHRKVFHHAFRAPVTPNYWPIQMRKAHELVQSLIQAPEDFFEHIQTFAASTIMSVVYGYEASSMRDPYVSIVEKAMHAMGTALTPTRSLILFTFPFLLKIPTWAPGGAFQRRAMELKELKRQMVDAPFRYVQDALTQGTAAPSMVSMALKDVDSEKDADQIETLKGIAATAYAGGAETVSLLIRSQIDEVENIHQTSSSVGIFFLAMVLYPEAQRRAQAEIDAVVGNDRLPTFEDRPAMPFLEATLRETLRWHPVAPLSLPRQAREADSFDGYHIPKGATVFPNIWAITHDDVRYPDPNDFKPERFLNSDGTLNDDAVGYVFGFGRRICPGRHFADASLWSAITSVLAVLKIEKPAGHFTEPEWILGQTSYPAPFLCRITPRVPERVEVLVGESI
ncbi:cytochrome P450 [Melanogaster broomeanus]|nr:cytochrome P450 [Melanogaster broomeanus]